MTGKALRVGITGHRPNRMQIGVERIARRLGLVLAALRAGAGDAQCFALSALAEGSDRLFAESALGRGYRLEVLLPFKSDDYETTFGETTTTVAYHSLLERATQVTELPGTLSDTKLAYEQVGRAMVDNCHIVVAVWDGKPSAGRGGTPEIIEYAISRATPVVWIDAAHDRLPMLLKSSRATALRLLAMRARSLSRRRLKLLASQAVVTA